MLLLSLTNISRRFDQQVIVQDVSLSVNRGEKIGLVGRNGTGKTTLFEIIAGRLRPDAGQIDYSRATRIGMVEQEVEEHRQLSVYDFCFLARPEINDMRLQMQRLENELESDNAPPELIAEFHTLTTSYEERGGYRLETEIRLVLEGIGFSRSQINRPLDSLSGGERNRAQIAAVLVGDYNLLLLDEPTNHLDIKATIWLENYIAASPHAFIIVSHDRRFLQNTVSKIVELSRGRLDFYHCRYEEFMEERRKRVELAEHHFRHQQEEIVRIEEFIRRNMAGQKTKQAQSKQKYLARMKKLEKPLMEKDQPTFKIKDGGRSFRLVLKVEDLGIGYNESPLVDDIQFELTRGDRVGLIGPNGCGKTTLLKTLGGDLEPLGGDITVGGNVDVAYFDQELSNLNPDANVISELWQVDPLAESGRLRSFLARFGFWGEDVFKKVGLLSGGEKTKLSLAKILYRPANLMIFDEPTNHLDIASIEALEEGLGEYNGTLLVVSHDRDFLDKIVNRVFEIDGGNLTQYLGNYSDFASRKGRNDKPIREVSEEKKASYREFREKSRQKSRYRKRLNDLTELITTAEARLGELDQDELIINGSDWEKLDSLRRERAGLEEDIINLYLEKESLEENPPDD